MLSVESPRRAKHFRIPPQCQAAIIVGLTVLLAAVALPWACSSDGLEGAPHDAAPGDAEDGAGGDAGPLPHDIGELGAGLSTLVGASNAGYVDGARNFSLFNNPVNVTIGFDGVIYVADFDNGLVRKVTPEGVATTLVKQAGFSRPFGMAFTSDGAFYVQTDRNSAGEATGALWRVSLDSGAATLVRDDVGRVRGLAGLSDGRLVLADKFAHTLRIYDPALDVMYALAGQNNEPGFDNGIGSAARFREPLDVVVDSNDVIYVADSGNHRIRRVTVEGVVTTIAGNGVGATVDGPRASASFDTPVGLALMSDEDIFVSEFGSGRTRYLHDGQVTTIAGSKQGFADHTDPLQGQLYVCEGLAYDAPYLYLADGSGGTDAAFHRVRRLKLVQ